MIATAGRGFFGKRHKGILAQFGRAIGHSEKLTRPRRIIGIPRSTITAPAVMSKGIHGHGCRFFIGMMISIQRVAIDRGDFAGARPEALLRFADELPCFKRGGYSGFLDVRGREFSNKTALGQYLTNI